MILRYIKEKQNKSLDSICDSIVDIGIKMAGSARMAFPVSNTLKRIVSLIRNIIRRQQKRESINDQQLRDLVGKRNNDDQMDDEDMEEGIKGVIKSIEEEIMEDFEGAFEEISTILQKHIGPEEIILTFGYSTLALECFTMSSKYTSSIKILVVDDLNHGSIRMVKELTEKGIESYRVAISSIYTIMPKVSKIIVSSHAVMADGGIIGLSGIYCLGMVESILHIDR